MLELEILLILWLANRISLDAIIFDFRSNSH